MASLELTNDTLQISRTSKHINITRYVDGTDCGRVETVKVPFYDIDRVVVTGTPNITIPTLTSFMDEGIPVFFVTAHGRWRGSLTPDKNLNAARRIRQYELGKDKDFSLKIAKALVYAKLRNCRRVLQRLAANRGITQDNDHQAACFEILRYANASVDSTDSVDVVRGYEGIGTAIYFQELGRYFPVTMPFKTRSRRPPQDPANALLSWTYTIILGEVECAVRAHGLDAALGHLHCDKSNTPSLSLDLIEPLRPAIADLLVLNIVNHHILKPDIHFEIREDDGGTYLNAEGRSAFFKSYEQAMERRFSIAQGFPHTDFRQVINEQVNIYLRALERGEEPEFFELP